MDKYIVNERSARSHKQQTKKIVTTEKKNKWKKNRGEEATVHKTYFAAVNCRWERKKWQIVCTVIMILSQFQHSSLVLQYNIILWKRCYCFCWCCGQFIYFSFIWGLRSQGLISHTKPHIQTRDHRWCNFKFCLMFGALLKENRFFHILNRWSLRRRTKQSNEEWKKNYFPEHTCTT